MRKILLILGLLVLISPAKADSNVNSMTASGAIVGTQLTYCPIGAASDLKCTFTQVAAYLNGLVSGDCTATGTGTFTCTETNGTAFTALATTAPGTGVATALGVNIGSAGAFVTFNGALGTPSSGTLTNATGLPIAGTTGWGTNVAAALANALNGASGLVGFSGALGTPTSGTLTNATGLPISTGVSGLGTGVATFLGTPSSANLAAALTDETGSGAAVFGTAPTISSVNLTTAAKLAYITGSTQCLNVDTTGAITGTGSVCGGSGSSGANPTATASDTAVNGVATTFMRSDAAPAVQKTSSSVFGLAKVDGTTITASGGVISSVGGSGTVTSVAAGCGTSTGGSAITTTGTVSASITKRANTTTSDTIVSTDCGNITTESNAGSIAVAIAQAGTTGFATGTYFELCNIGVGTATVTPTTSTIGGASTYALPGGTAAAPVCVGIQSDGANYNVVPDWMANASLFTTGTVAAARGGAGTVNGALKGNGSGAVSQAACADLSNGTALCSTTPGTGVATALGVAVGSAGAPVVNGGALGTPSSGTLTSATGLPISTGVSGLGTGVATAAAANLSAAGGLTTTIASGALTLNTTAVSSATCGTVQTATATNTATTDVVLASFNGDPTAVTGYVPLTTGMLTIITYPTANTFNIKICNNTSASITPGAITLNWRVVR
jgi:hypothetical protein